MQKLVLLIILFISIISKISAQDLDNLIIPPHVANQADLAKYQAGQYVKNFPHSAYECALYLSRISTYHQLLRSEGPSAFVNAFKLNSLKKTPNTENQFPFDNSAVGEVCEHRFGYCHGYTTSLTYWNRLAHFDPENINQANYPKEIGTDEWFNYYRAIIDDLMVNRNPVIIPGFHHLFEFVDSDPRLTRYIKEHIALKWAQRNINISSYFKVLKAVYHHFDTEQAKLLHEKLNFRINELQFNPIVWIARPSDGPKSILGVNDDAGIHNMQAYKVTPIDANGDYKVYFWDIYSPYDASEASRVYTISTKKINNKGKANVTQHKENQNGEIISTKEEVDSRFTFADMDTVPFDDLNIGEDARKLLAFYQKNEKFTKYLEKKFNNEIKNPPPAFRAPYRGEDKSKFEIILSDGSIWEVPERYQYFSGELWIEPHQIRELPLLVQNSLDTLIKKSWRKGAKISRYEFQKPMPFNYTDSSGKTVAFNFDIKWFNFKGEFMPTEDFMTEAPVQLKQALKEYTIKWPITEPLNFKYFSDSMSYQRTLYGDGKLLWKAPVEFIKDGGLFIPQNLEKYVPARVISYLKRNNLWPLKTPVRLQILDPNSRSLQYGMDQKFVFPIEWFSKNSVQVVINEERFNQLPEELKIIFTSFKNPTFDKTIQVSIDRLMETILKRENTTYIFPLKWLKDGEQITIPDDEMPYAPDNLRTLIVGRNGTWPAQHNTFTRYSFPLTLKNKTKYYWPMSWIDQQNYELRIRPGDEHVVPAEVIAEIFSSGPYIWPLTGKKIDAYQIQLRPITLENGSVWFWPREWMDPHNFGRIILPKSDKKVNEILPLEIQQNIKLLYGGKYPADRKVSADGLAYGGTVIE